LEDREHSNFTAPDGREWFAVAEEYFESLSKTIHLQAGESMTAKAQFFTGDIARMHDPRPARAVVSVNGDTLWQCDTSGFPGVPPEDIVFGPVADISFIAPVDGDYTLKLFVWGGYQDPSGASLWNVRVPDPAPTVGLLAIGLAGLFGLRGVWRTD
jgi:hypothetical protein